MTSPAKKFTRAEKLEELWRRGILVPWLCHPVQQQMAAAIQGSASKKYVINSARRLGKSYLLCCLALERALQFPNQQIKYASETQRSVKKITLPLFRQILETCPKHLRPKFHAHDNMFTFTNGSEIHIAGSSLDQADGLRGTAADLCLIDEAGFIGDLEYLIDSVLLPQTLNRKNAKLILASTPSKTPDHPFVQRFMAEAIAGGYYSKFTIYDNPLLTPEIIEEFKKESGGDETVTWRREYLAEPVTDLSNALFPEATNTQAMDELVLQVQRPPGFLPIVSIDLGYLDYTGVLFGYYHFPMGKIVIEAELLVNKMTSKNIVEMVVAKERELWGNLPTTRIVDGGAMIIADLNETHNFNCRTPEKSDLTANVNRVRMDLDNKRILFSPAVPNTISQVRYAVWNTARSGFARSSSGGHFDLAAALIYLCKHVDRTTNPIRADYGYSYYTDFGFPRKHKQESMDAIKAMFPATFRKQQI